jgi:thiamine pyrophosphate-dependent acetolactate synthase large subunit-like protein
MSGRNDLTLDRRAVVATLLDSSGLDGSGLDGSGELLVVTSLGHATYDAAAAGDRKLNFYLWGAMGGTAMIGLGLALAQPRRRVLVLTGDGDMLMGLGSLATIAAARAANLAIAVLDNAAFGETGAQASHTGLGTDLAAVAAACGWGATATASSMPEVAALRPRLRREPLFAVIRISLAEVPRHLPPRDGAHLADRFRRALGLPEA